MSEENVEVVRRFLAPDEGEDLVPRIRAAVRQLGPDFAPGAVLAFWAEDPAMKHVHPDVEWHSGVTGLSAPTRGPRELTLWLADWVESWETLVNRTAGYRDLGEWVFVRVDTRGRGRDGIKLEMQRFALYQVRDGKISAYRSFGTEADALKAVGVQ